MPSPLLPSKLSASVVATLAGRSIPAVWKARRRGEVVSFGTADVEQWLGRQIDPLNYLQAERIAHKRRAYVRARKQRTADV